jgi:hypothetical protein
MRQQRRRHVRHPSAAMAGTTRRKNRASQTRAAEFVDNDAAGP